MINLVVLRLLFLLSCGHIDTILRPPARKIMQKQNVIPNPKPNLERTHVTTGVRSCRVARPCHTSLDSPLSTQEYSLDTRICSKNLGKGLESGGRGCYSKGNGREAASEYLFFDAVPVHDSSSCPSPGPTRLRVAAAGLPHPLGSWAKLTFPPMRRWVRDRPPQPFFLREVHITP
jgi:hypothetical protein